MKKVPLDTRGGRLRALRNQKKTKQADLGAALGVTRSHITKVETGADEGGREFWEAAAAEFDVSVDYLLFGNAKRTNGSDVHVPGIGQIHKNPGEVDVLLVWRTIKPEMHDLGMRLLRNLAEAPGPSPGKIDDSSHSSWPRTIKARRPKRKGG